MLLRLYELFDPNINQKYKVAKVSGLIKSNIYLNICEKHPSAKRLRILPRRRFKGYDATVKLARPHNNRANVTKLGRIGIPHLPKRNALGNY